MPATIGNPVMADWLIYFEEIGLGTEADRTIVELDGRYDLTAEDLVDTDE